MLAHIVTSVVLIALCHCVACSIAPPPPSPLAQVPQPSSFVAAVVNVVVESQPQRLVLHHGDDIDATAVTFAKQHALVAAHASRQLAQAVVAHAGRDDYSSPATSSTDTSGIVQAAEGTVVALFPARTGHGFTRHLLLAARPLSSTHTCLQWASLTAARLGAVLPGVTRGLEEMYEQSAPGE